MKHTLTKQAIKFITEYTLPLETKMQKNNLRSELYGLVDKLEAKQGPCNLTDVELEELFDDAMEIVSMDKTEKYLEDVAKRADSFVDAPKDYNSNVLAALKYNHFVA